MNRLYLEMSEIEMTVVAKTLLKEYERLAEQGLAVQHTQMILERVLARMERMRLSTMA